MSLGVTNWPLLFKIMLDFTSRIFALKSCELSVREMFSLGMVSTCSSMWGGYRIAGNGKVFFLTSG